MPIILDPSSVNSTMGFITNLRGQRIQDRQFGEDLEFRKQQLDVSSDLDQQRINHAMTATELENELGNRKLDVLSEDSKRTDLTNRYQIDKNFEVQKAQNDEVAKVNRARITRELGKDAAVAWDQGMESLRAHSEVLAARESVLRQEAAKQNGGAPLDEQAYNTWLPSTPEGQSLIRDQIDTLDRIQGLGENYNITVGDRYKQLGLTASPTGGKIRYASTPNGVAISAANEATGEATMATANGDKGGKLNEGDDVTVIQNGQLGAAIGTALSVTGKVPQYVWGNLAETGTRNERELANLNPVDQAVMSGESTPEGMGTAQDSLLSQLSKNPGNRVDNPQKNPAIWGLPTITQPDISDVGLRTGAPSNNPMYSHFVEGGTTGQPPPKATWYQENFAQNKVNSRAGTSPFGKSPQEFEEFGFYENPPKATWQDIGAQKPVEGQAKDYTVPGTATGLIAAQVNAGMATPEHGRVMMEGAGRGRNYSSNKELADAQMQAERDQAKNDSASRGDHERHAVEQMAAGVQENAAAGWGLTDPADVARFERALTRRTGQKLFAPDGTVTPGAALFLARAYKDNPEAILKAANLNPAEVPRNLADMTPHQRKLVVKAAMASLTPRAGFRKGLHAAADVARNTWPFSIGFDTDSEAKKRTPVGPSGSVLDDWYK